MFREAIITLIDVNKFDVIKYLREELNFSLREAYEAVNEKSISFQNYKEALKVFEHFQTCGFETRLQIDVTRKPFMGMGAFGVVINTDELT